MAFSSQKHTTQDLLFLIPLSFFFLLYRLGSGSLASWDEAIYASVAKEILQTGDWFALRLNGEPWLERAPLAVWATALFYQLFGVSEFTARLFSALCGAGCVLTTYVLGRRFFDRWVGFLAALVLLSSSDFLRYSRFGMLDAPFMLFLTWTFLFFWMGQNRNRYLIFSGITLGLAVLTKGYVAFLSFPVIWLYAFFSGRVDVLGRSSYWIGVMIAAAIALPWHLGQLFLYRSVGPREFTWPLTVRPFQVLDVPGSQWYYYVRVLVNKFHPWILVGVVTAPWCLFKAAKDREENTIFLSTWIFFIFLAVTVFHLKRSWFILPIYPALSVTIAYALSLVFRERRVPFIRVMFLVIMALHIPYSHVFDHDYSRQIKALAVSAEAKVPKGEALVLYNFHESPAVSFYIGRASVMADSPDELAERLRTGFSYLLIKQEDMRLQPVSFLLSKNRMLQVALQDDLALLVRKT